MNTAMKVDATGNTITSTTTTSATGTICIGPTAWIILCAIGATTTALVK
jgi:hypothetical protein